MNKKVLSAILFSALFAGTGTFTSCIDNDEPAGIEELRGAKAELIRAKVAVEQAEAAYKLAQAELEKAKAAKEAALAKQEEAKAKKEQAIAEQQEAATAKEKALAEQEIAKAQQAMEIALLQHQAALLEEKQALAEAQREYEIAIKQIEIAKALMSEESKIAVSDLVKDVEDLNKKIAKKQAKIDGKVAELNSAALVFELDSAFEVAKAEASLKAKKAELDANAELIAKYKKYLANDSTLEESAWREEIAKIEAEIAEYDKQIAVFKVDSAKALNGEERKALDKAIADAKKALSLEQDTLDNMVLAENVADTLLWYNDVQNDMTTIKFDKNTSAVVFAKAVAGDNYADAKDSLDYKGILEELRKEHDSYTTERQYWLDSIARKSASATTKDAENAEKVKKAYTDAKAAYIAGKALSTDALSKETTGAIAVLDKALTDAAGKENEAVLKSKAWSTFADAVVAYYNSLPAAQATVNSVTLKVAGKETYNTKTIVAWLSDADYKDVYAESVVTYFGGDKAKLYALNTVEKEELNTATGEPTTRLNGAFKTFVQKEVKDEQYTKEEKEGKVVYTAKSLLGSLQVASLVAFGDASNYVIASEMTGLDQKGYLQDVPSNDDIKYVALTLSKEVGTWGDYVLSLDDKVDYLTNNHKAIKADLKAAIDNLTALVDEIRDDSKKANDDILAAELVVTAAEQALTDYTEKIKADYIEATAELDANLTYMKRLADDLGYAVDLYLSNAGIYQNYNGEALFVKFLTDELKKAEENVIHYEYAVAKAEYYLQLTKDGGFDAAMKLEIVKKELAELEAEMAELVKQLSEAVEKLATAEEIWNAAE